MKKSLNKFGKELRRAVLETTISKTSPDRRKKALTKLGYVSINKPHSFSERVNDFQISPRLQELMVYMGSWIVTNGAMNTWISF
jgi:hypothetical protein